MTYSNSEILLGLKIKASFYLVYCLENLYLQLSERKVLNPNGPRVRQKSKMSVYLCVTCHTIFKRIILEFCYI